MKKEILVIDDNPELTTRLVNGNNPIRIVLDPNNRIPSNSKVLSNQSKTIIFSSTKNPELKIEWIFIDEQFVEVKNSTLPDLLESDRDKFMVPDSFKPQPQRFLGESEEIPPNYEEAQENQPPSYD